MLTCLCACYGCASLAPQQWSVGIYTGKEPLDLASAAGAPNPVLTAADVTDVSAEFVADPFMVRDKDKWYMFFEVMNQKTRHGDIGLATSGDGLHWTYDRIVLDEPFHLSYPCVFGFEDRYYMVPETYQADGVRLYRADEFPGKWSFVSTLVAGSWLDPTVFRHGDWWWMFACKGNTMLHLFYSDRPEGPWKEHPKSPVIRGDLRTARPGGRVLAMEGRIVRFAQDDFPSYGSRVRAFEITRLTATDYEEREIAVNTVLGASGSGWNADGMHHIDAHRLDDGGWIACVDGWHRRTARP
jgi:hypothetical protein